MEFSEIFDADWLALITRFSLNLLMVFIAGRFLYYRRNMGKSGFLFAYISLSTIVFAVCILLSQVSVEIGFALGLFAVFSIVRFRSLQVTPRELSYLFVCLGLAVLNALANPEQHILRIIVSNLLILSTVGISEHLLFSSGKIVKNITYDRPDLIRDDRRNELEQDLLIRFGIEGIKQIQTGDIDAVKNQVKLKITFVDKSGNNFQEL